MARPGDIVVFDPLPDTGLCRTPSNYDSPNLELFPTPGDFYVMCQDKSFQRWPPDGEALGWEYVTVNNQPHVRITQFGFQPVQVRMKIMERARNIPNGYGVSVNGTINEQPDDGEPSENSVLSGPPPPLARRNTTKW